MSQIKLNKKKIYSGWDEAMTFSYIAKEIACIVEGEKAVYSLYKNNSSTQVGNGNNFWLLSEGDSYKLTARYWTEREQLEAVKTILTARMLC